MKAQKRVEKYMKAQKTKKNIIKTSWKHHENIIKNKTSQKHDKNMTKTS
jgi:hypothetical protein